MNISEIALEKKHIWDFEEVESCMICGNHEKHGAIGVSWEGVGFSYCYCTNCGLKYMNPRPTAESYQRYYVDSYWQERMTASGYATGSKYDDPDVDQLALRMPKYKSVYRKVKRDISSVMDITPDKKVLEVGCAFGYTLEWLKRDFGCKVYGIEPSSLSVQRCEEGGVEIIGSTAEGFFFDEENLNSQNKFDVIFFRHVLAQIVDVKDLVIQLKKFLTPNGMVIIYTPNNFYFSLTDPYHVNIFTPQTMEYFMNSCGYEVFKSIHSPDPTNHKSAVSIRPSYEIVCFAKASETVKLNFEIADPFKIAAMEKMGGKTWAWQSLSAKDLLSLLIKNFKNRLGL